MERGERGEERGYVKVNIDIITASGRSGGERREGRGEEMMKII